MEKREKIVKILKKAQKDKVFRKRLLDNPEATLKQEGVALPAGTHIQFLENEKDTFYYLLPSMEENLSDDDLKKLAAGFGPARRRPKGDASGFGCATCGGRSCGGR